MTGDDKTSLPILVVATAGLGLLTVWLMVWTPAEGDVKSPWAAPAVGFFFLVLLYVTLTEVMRRRVVVEMRTAAATRPVVDEPERTDPLARPPALRVDTITPNDMPASRAAPPEAVRGRAVFDRAVALHRTPITQLSVLSVIVALLALMTGQSFPLPAKPLFLLIVAPLILRFTLLWGVRQPRLTIHYLAWALLHGAWLAVTCYVAGSYVVAAVSSALRTGHPGRAPLVLAALTIVAVADQIRRLSAARESLRREVLAARPIALLFLWVFGDGRRINSLLLGIGSVWRCLGPLQFLQGGEMIGMGSDVFRHFRGSALVATTDEDVDRRIARFEWAPHRWMIVYATNTLLCGDRSWRHALDRLLDTDLVLMDLCGFTPANAGCVYEIGQIVNRIPASHVVFIVDRATRMDALRETLETAWARMSPSSPNCRPDCGALRLFLCDSEYDKGELNVRTVQRNADCLLDLLCGAVEPQASSPAPAAVR